MNYKLIGASFPDLSISGASLPAYLKGTNHNLSIQHKLPPGAGTYELAKVDTGADISGMYNLFVSATMHDGVHVHFLDFKAFVTATNMTFFGPNVNSSAFVIVQTGNTVAISILRNGVTDQAYNIRVEIRPVTLQPIFKVAYSEDPAKLTQIFF
jgi:hypothetical protein